MIGAQLRAAGIAGALAARRGLDRDDAAQDAAEAILRAPIDWGRRGASSYAVARGLGAATRAGRRRREEPLEEADEVAAPEADEADDGAPRPEAARRQLLGQLATLAGDDALAEALRRLRSGAPTHEVAAWLGARAAIRAGGCDDGCKFLRAKLRVRSDTVGRRPVSDRLPEGLISLADAAKLVGVARSTIARACERREIASHVVSGGKAVERASLLARYPIREEPEPAPNEQAL